MSKLKFTNYSWSASQKGIASKISITYNVTNRGRFSVSDNDTENRPLFGAPPPQSSPLKGEETSNK